MLQSSLKKRTIQNFDKAGENREPRGKPARMVRASPPEWYGQARLNEIHFGHPDSSGRGIKPSMRV